MPQRIHGSGNERVAGDHKPLRRHQNWPDRHSCSSHNRRFWFTCFSLHRRAGDSGWLPGGLRTGCHQIEREMNGVFLKEGETVERTDTDTGQMTLDQLEDERAFDSGDVEWRITAPDRSEEHTSELQSLR